MAEVPNNFTPIMDNIASQLGLIPAAVYGVVWRYCQMDDGVCRASLQTMGEKLGANKATVLRHLKELCNAGLIKDLDEGKRNAAHRYKLNDNLLQSATVDEHKVLQSATVDNDNLQTVAECNATVAECNATVAESQLKILDTIEETNIAPKPQKPKRKPPSTEKGQKHNAMFSALAKVTCVDLSVISDKDRGKINKASAVMADKYSPDDVTGFEVWWYKNDWRGQKGQPPTLEQVRSEWGKYRRGPVNGNGAAHPHQPETELVPDKEFTL